MLAMRGSFMTLAFTCRAELEDDTFKDAGAIKVWTKADSVTLFDDFTFESTK
jgi:hypothetical protein